MPKNTPVDLPTLRRLAGEKRKLTEIALIMGYDHGTISKASKRHKIEVVDVVRRYDGRRGGSYPRKHTDPPRLPPPRPSMHALAQFDPVIARALKAHLAAL